MKIFNFFTGQEPLDLYDRRTGLGCVWHAAKPERVSFHRQGEYLQFETLPGDRWKNERARSRAEATPITGVVEKPGVRAIWSWEMFWPDDYRPHVPATKNAPSYNSMAQMHCNPIGIRCGRTPCGETDFQLLVSTHKDRKGLLLAQYRNPAPKDSCAYAQKVHGPLIRGAWYRFHLDVLWNKDGRGYMLFSVNDEHLVNTLGPNMAPPCTHNGFKLGLMHPPATWAQRVLMRHLKVEYPEL